MKYLKLLRLEEIIYLNQFTKVACFFTPYQNNLNLFINNTTSVTTGADATIPVCPAFVHKYLTQKSDIFRCIWMLRLWQGWFLYTRIRAVFKTSIELIPEADRSAVARNPIAPYRSSWRYNSYLAQWNQAGTRPWQARGGDFKILRYFPFKIKAVYWPFLD